MPKNDKWIVYQKYSEILDGIFTYQDQQVELREMCLKIMLGTFGLVGGLLFIKVDVSSQALLILSAIFPFLSLFIVSVNLVVDLIYKERLKLAFVSEALRLEAQYHWLPKFHISLINKNNRNNIAASGQIIYYLGSAGLLMLMSAIALSIDPIFSSILSKFIIFLTYLCLYIVYQFFMSKLVKKTKVILEILENGQ